MDYSVEIFVDGTSVGVWPAEAPPDREGLAQTRAMAAYLRAGGEGFVQGAFVTYSVTPVAE